MDAKSHAEGSIIEHFETTILFVRGEIIIMFNVYLIKVT